MNPYIALFAVLGLIGVFGAGVGVGKKWEEGRNAIEQNHIAEAVDAANAASAEAIAGIKVTNQTINNKVRHEVETNTVYSDCKLTSNGVFLANSALSGTKPPSGGELPKTDPIK